MTTQGERYLLARAQRDGRIDTALVDLGRYRALGMTPLAEEAITTLNDLAYARHDGAPAYTDEDAGRAADALYRQHTQAR